MALITASRILTSSNGGVVGFQRMMATSCERGALYTATLGSFDKVSYSFGVSTARSASPLCISSMRVWMSGTTRNTISE